MSLKVVYPTHEIVSREEAGAKVQIALPPDINKWIEQVRDGFGVGNKDAAINILLRDYFVAVGGQCCRIVPAE